MRLTQSQACDLSLKLMQKSESVVCCRSELLSPTYLFCGFDKYIMTRVTNMHFAPQKLCSMLNNTNPLKPELNPICYLLALLGAHHFLHVSRIRVKLLTFRLLISYIYIYIYIWSTHS